eukprot:g3461.t1
MIKVKVAEVPVVDLVDGVAVSRLIHGTGATAFGRLPAEQLLHSLAEHRTIGIDTVDTADAWGHCEATVGEFIGTTRYGAGRRPVAITRYSPQPRHRISKADVAAALCRSRERLGMRGAERLDVVLLMWADFSVRHYVQVARHLDALRREGGMAALGVTDFDVARLEELLRAGVRVDCVLAPMSLLDRRATRAVERAGDHEGGAPQSLLAFCEARGIPVLARGVLAGGWLSESFVGALPHAREAPMPNPTLAQYLPCIQALDSGWRPSWSRYQQLLLALDAIALKHGSTIPNVAARWVLDHSPVVALVVGATDASHALENTNVFSLALDDGDRTVIERVLAPCLGPKGDVAQEERRRGPLCV